MFEKIWESAWGKWGLAAGLWIAMPGGRKMVRSVLKEVVKVGLTASESIKEVVAEIKEEAEDVVAEIKAERAQTEPSLKHVHKASEK